MKSYDLSVDAAQSGKRLDVFLAESGLELSKRKIRQVIDVGGVYVNRKRVRVASRQVTRGDKVRFEYNEHALKQLKTQRPEFKANDILWSGDHVIAVNKPPGMAAQATKDQSIMHVVPCLAALLKELGRPHQKLLLAHRLDKETSGVLLTAEGTERATWLTEQFKQRLVEKTYLALCYGIPKQIEFTENAYLSEIDKRSGDVRAVRSGGRQAMTRFKVLAMHKDLGVSLVACYPHTGRSHQIRVHLQINDLPIIGDKRYTTAGRKNLPSALAELAAVHHFLHARALAFTPAPGAPRQVIKAPLPDRFAAFMQAIGFHGDSGEA